MSSTQDDDHDLHAASRERLSALMDGELGGGVVHQACGHWRETAESRATWHVYHVIGDVLRSDDLAGGAGRNAAFLASLRERLAGEPVVLAPAPLEGSGSDRLVASRDAPDAAGVGRSTGRLAWRRTVAIAAGVVAVVGLGWLVRVPMPSGATGGTQPLALAGDAGLVRGAPASSSPGGVATVSVAGDATPAPSAAGPRALSPGDPLIRDARLDRYLQAHQQFAGSSALGVPSGFLRAATTESVAR